jgi:hypothetical protein
MIAWIAKRLILTLPLILFRRSFVGGILSFLLLRKLSNKDSAQNRRASASSQGRYW